MNDILKKMKRRGRRIVALTCYDYLSARLLDDAGVDVILVGDSLGMVVFGRDSTMAVSIDEIVHHVRAVKAGVRNALLWADLPLCSLKKGVKKAVEEARQLIKAGAVAVKVEGGVARVPLVKAMAAANIPAVGHIGLTPQFADRLGGYRLQGKTSQEALKIVADARALEKAGVTAVVLEVVPEQLACYLTTRLSIPTIGIGAGKGCDGQIMVQHDMLGIYWYVAGKKAPKFLKEYAHLADVISSAVANYSGQVRRGTYPGRKQTYRLKRSDWLVVETALESQCQKRRPGGAVSRRKQNR